MTSRHLQRRVVRQAFTLMEMLVVVAIIVVLAGIGGYYYMGQLDRAKLSAAKLQVNELSKACETYEMNNGSRPPSLAALLQADQATGKPLLDRADALLTPWSTQYMYDANGPRNNGLKPDIWAETPNGPIGNWSK
jgi:general secretion pathway protein G